MKDIAINVNVEYTLTAEPGSVSDYGTITANAKLASLIFGSTIIAKDGKLDVTINTLSGSVSDIAYDLDSHSWVIRFADKAAHSSIVSAVTDGINKAMSTMKD